MGCRSAMVAVVMTSLAGGCLLNATDAPHASSSAAVSEPLRCSRSGGLVYLTGCATGAAGGLLATLRVECWPDSAEWHPIECTEATRPVLAHFTVGLSGELRTTDVLRGDVMTCCFAHDYRARHWPD